jgi:hypothetical protein
VWCIDNGIRVMCWTCGVGGGNWILEQGSWSRGQGANELMGASDLSYGQC